MHQEKVTRVKGNEWGKNSGFEFDLFLECLNKIANMFTCSQCLKLFYQKGSPIL